MDIRGIAQALNLDPLRLLEGQGALKAVLAELTGTDVEALLAGRTTDGLLLQLLGGRTVVASGDLPFPDGTRLLLRAVPAPDTGAIRLQPLEATPPPPDPVLLPLAQGEAAPLLQRLLGPDPLPVLLAPLRALLQQAAEPPPATPPALEAPPAAAVLSSAVPEAAPTPPTATPAPAAALAALAPESLPLLKARLAAFPPSARETPPPPIEAALAQDLAARGLPPETAKAWASFLLEEPAEVASVDIPTPPPSQAAPPPSEGEPLPIPAAIRAWVEATAPAKEEAAEGVKDTRLPRPTLLAHAEELRKAQVPEALVQRLVPLLALARPSANGALEQLFKALIPRLLPPESKAVLPSTPLPGSSPAVRENAPQTLAVPAPVLKGPWLHADTWEGWLRGTTTALADPSLSPREAPFHALQAREQTALFELPLPLPGLQGPVELWVERDRESSSPGQDPEVRVLLALEFEGMGQVRLGIEGRGGQVRADLWVEEERRPAVAAALAAELGHPPPYPVQVRGFQGHQPGLRQVAGAGAFGALG